MNTTVAAKVAGGTTALGGIAVGGTYVATKDSIGSKVKEFVLSKDSEQSEWDKAQKQFKARTLNESTIKELKDLHTKLNSSNAGNESLKATCLSLYDKSYGSALSSKDDNLADQVKEHCRARKTVFDSVKDFVLPEGLEATTANGAWKKAQDKLKAVTASTDTNVDGLIDIFKTLHPKLQESSGEHKDNTDGSPMKTGCLKVYETITEGKTDAEKTKFETQAKTYCSYTIKEKLVSESSIDDSKLFLDSTGETNKTDISSLIGTQQETNKDDFFKKLKGNAENWTKWRDECQRLYKLQWDNKDQNTDGNYKLAHTYCKKTN